MSGDVPGQSPDRQHRLAASAFGHRTPEPPSQRPRVRQAYLLLQVWDRLSLQFAFRHAADGVLAPVPLPVGASGQLTCRNPGEFRLRLDPYPFLDDEVVLPVLGHLVEDRRYRDPEDFLATLVHAPPRWLECGVSR